MTLRTRLLVGYGYLVLLILLAAGGSAVGFFDLSRGIDRILRENVESVTATIHMLEALERQDSATLAALVQEGPGDDVRENLEEADEAFREALERARNNITIEGEQEVVEAIAERYANYGEQRDRLIEEHPANPLAEYNKQTFPTFSSVKLSVLGLLEMNRVAMVEADREARQSALQNGVWLGVLVTIALLSLVYLSRALRTHLIARLTYFKETSEAIAAGDQRRRLKAGADDELGAIARHFNAALDTQQQLRAEAQGRLNQQRQVLLGALEERGEPVALLGLDGSVIAATMGQEDLEQVANEGRRAQHEWRDLRSGFERDEEPPVAQIELDDGRTLRFRLLVARGERPVGWMCRIVSNGA